MQGQGERKTVKVWANGCYDVYHFGHANFLRQAKLMGDHLIAGLHGDVDIANNKAPPVMKEAERARIISSVKWVDEVKSNIPYGNVLKTLDENSCDFCVHGDDVARDANGCDIYLECQKKGRFKECQRTKGISTTLLIDRILLFGAGGQTHGCDMPHAEKAKSLSLPVPEEYYQEKIKLFSSGNTVPKGNEKILYSQGVFDLFHSGHIDFLEKCKKNVDDSFLVVGILSDDEVYRVFGSYPVTNTFERALALMSCKFADRVMIGVPFEISTKFLEDHKVEYVYHGRFLDLPSDPYSAARKKNVFRRVDSDNDTTTAMIIQRVINNKEIYSERNAKKPESLFSNTSP